MALATWLDSARLGQFAGPLEAEGLEELPDLELPVHVLQQALRSAGLGVCHRARFWAHRQASITGAASLAASCSGSRHPAGAGHGSEDTDDAYISLSDDGHEAYLLPNVSRNRSDTKETGFSRGSQETDVHHLVHSVETGLTAQVCSASHIRH